MTRPFRSAAWCITLVLVLSPERLVRADAAAAPAAVSIDELSIGLNGAFKAGRWTQARLRVTAAAPVVARLEIEAIDPEGNLTRHVGARIEGTSDGPSIDAPARDVAIPSGRSSLVGLFQFGRLEGSLRVRLVAGDRTLAENRVDFARGALGGDLRSAPLPQSVLLVAALGRSAGLASDPDNATLSPRVHYASLGAPEDLPEDSAALDGVDCLLFNGVPELGAAQLRAVESWVLRGGRLVLCIGRDASRLRNPGHPWEWLGLSFLGTTRPRELSAVKGFIGANDPIVIPPDALAARIAAPDAFVRLSGLDGPLLVDRAIGFGRVTVFGINMPEWGARSAGANDPPAWPPLPDLLRKLVVGPSRTSATKKPSGQIAQQGTTDLSTQLRSVQDEFPEVNRPTAWTVLGFLAAYILLIGPADYFLVHRVLRRPHLTWASLLIIAAASATGAAWVAGRFNGNALRLNQLDVVDVDVASRQVRGRSLFTLYSPDSRRYDVQVEPAREWPAGARAITQSRQPWLCWDGVPEETFGGMYRASGLGLRRAEYDVDGAAGAISRLPIPEWGAKALVAGWETEADLASSQLESPGVNQLAGTITHRLSGPITDWILAYGNRVYVPRSPGEGRSLEIRPGQPFHPVRVDVLQRELNGYLTGATATRVMSREKTRGEEILVEQRPWDAFGGSPADVLQMITFHDRADGAQYTGLSNDGYRRLELSGLLDMGRAVLFGRIDAPAAGLRVSSGSGGSASRLAPAVRRVSFVRLVFPVRQTGTVPRTLRNLAPPPSSQEKQAASGDEPADAELPAPPSSPDRETPAP